MKKIGLTGGIGSGKSTVARMLSDHNIPIIDADRIARSIVEPGTPALAELVDAFGSDILHPDGSLRRAELARRAFATPEATSLLNTITHPRIQAETSRQFAQAEAAGQPRASSGRVFLAAFTARAVHLLSALTVCFFAFTHALHAAYKTGRLDAYLATELGWSGRTVEDGHHYVVQWVDELSLYLNRWSTGAIITLIVAGFAAYFLWLFSRSTRTLLHPVMLIWCVCYAVYLGIFWLPQSSTFRILLPLFPFALVLMSYGKDSKAYRWLLVLSGVLMQLVWVGWLWHSHGPGDMQLP